MAKRLMITITVILLITITISPVTESKQIKHIKNIYQDTIIEKETSKVISDSNDCNQNYEYDIQKLGLSRDVKEDFKLNYHPMELIIKFNEDCNVTISLSFNNIIKTGISSIDILNEKFKVYSAEKLFDEFSISSISSVYKLIFSEDTDINLVVKEYNKDLNIEYAKPNYVSQLISISNNDLLDFMNLESSQLSSNSPLSIPNDPLFNEQWALNQSNECDIDAPEAWEIETGDNDVIIAIIDTGVDYIHEDLIDNIWCNTDEIPDNGVDDDGNGFKDDIRGWDFVNNDNDPIDDQGHGTRCSGVTNAVTNNSIGIAGVSWNCKIMPIKVLDKDGTGYDDDIAKGIYYAVENDADIISMSFGSYMPQRQYFESIVYAYDHGVVLVGGAGNDNTDFELMPACLDQVIAVTATDKNDKKASFSNYGEWIDVAAPGVDILTTNIGDEYKELSGTTASCQHVAGLAALLLSKYDQCPYPAQMVKSVISYTTDKIESDKIIGTGRINAYNALTHQPFAVDLEPILVWEDVKGTIDLKGTVWGDNLQYFVLEIGKDERPSTWTELLNSSTIQAGILLSLDTTLLDEGLHTLRIKAVYSYGVFLEEKLIYINNKADGNFEADIFVSNCFDNFTPGWGITHFDKIQEGIDATKKGDTVFVYDGVYTEDIEITGKLLGLKTINLIGQNNTWTIIKGYINISYAKETSVSDFTIRGGLGIDSKSKTYYEISIYLSSKCTVEDCNIFNHHYLNNVLTIDYSLNCNIKNNSISSIPGFPNEDNGCKGIVIGGSYKNNISENRLMNQHMCIVMGRAKKNIIYKNTVKFNSFGICMTWGSSANRIVENKIENNIYCGIDIMGLLLPCSRNIFYKNIIANHTRDLTVAVEIDGIACNNKFIANTFVDNWYGIYLSETSFMLGNIFYLNNFMRSDQRHAQDDGDITLWYKPKGLFKGMGNYWDDYDGEDKDGDGIGDTPYKNIATNKNFAPKDRFPFMNPIDIDGVDGVEVIKHVIWDESEKNWSNQFFLNSIFSRFITSLLSIKNSKYFNEIYNWSV